MSTGRSMLSPAGYGTSTWLFLNTFYFITQLCGCDVILDFYIISCSFPPARPARPGCPSLLLLLQNSCPFCLFISFHYSLLQLQRLCWNHSTDLKKFVNVFWPFRNATINAERGTYARGELFKEKCFISRKLSRRQNIYDFDNSGRHSRLLTGMHPEHCFKSHWKQLRVEKE